MAYESFILWATKTWQSWGVNARAGSWRCFKMDVIVSE